MRRKVGALIECLAAYQWRGFDFSAALSAMLHWSIAFSYTKENVDKYGGDCIAMPIFFRNFAQ